MPRILAKADTFCLLSGPGAALAELFNCVEEVQFWIKDRAGRYLAMNGACLLNYSLVSFTEAAGRTDFDLSPPHIAMQFRLDDDRVLRGESIVNRIELVGRFDHTAVWCVTNKMPLRNARGRIIGTAGVARPLPRGAPLLASSDAALARAVSVMRERLDQPLDNATLADQAGLSLRSFERRFHAAFQLAPQQYLRRLRVRLACHALVYSDQALSEIAAAHGFCDQSHFGREFRHETQMTPREYRERFRKR